MSTGLRESGPGEFVTANRVAVVEHPVGKPKEMGAHALTSLLVVV